MQSHLDAVLAELMRSRGIDLSGYRRSMLQRRLMARMARIRCDCPADYLAQLQTDPAECDRLVEAVAINVSSFFRNPVVWEILAQSVLPELIERKRRTGGREIRVWSAGCAAGEEAFSAAILIHRALKGELADWRLSIFATDVDANTLTAAAEGVYSHECLENTKLGILGEYFTTVENGYRLRPFIRKLVSFSRDSLASPDGFAPKESIFGSFDLVFCRNVLIYFSLELQEVVLDKLIRTLDDGGYLILGDSESLSRKMQPKLFEVDGRNRIFQKRG